MKRQGRFRYRSGLSSARQSPSMPFHIPDADAPGAQRGGRCRPRCFRPNDGVRKKPPPRKDNTSGKRSRSSSVQSVSRIQNPESPPVRFHAGHFRAFRMFIRRRSRVIWVMRRWENVRDDPPVPSPARRRRCCHRRSPAPRFSRRCDRRSSARRPRWCSCRPRRRISPAAP